MPDYWHLKGRFMLASSQRLRVLQRLPWLGDLPVSELAPLAAAFRERSLRRGAALVEPGEPTRHVHVVVEGKVDAQAFPSPAIGLIEVLARDGAGVSAVAETDALVLELSAADLYHALEHSFPLLLAVVRGLTLATLERGLPPVFRVGSHVPCNDCVDLVAQTLHLRQSAPAAVRMGAIHLERGTDLWREGDTSGYGVVVLSGEIMTKERGRDRIDRARPGVSLGMREALAGLPRWHDAVAVADTVLMRADADAMLDVLEDQAELAGDMAHAIACGLLGAHRKAA
jgi:CRP-like cAMP-binding protein